MLKKIVKVNLKGTRTIYLIDFPKEYENQICKECNYFGCIYPISTKVTLDEKNNSSNNMEKSSQISSALQEKKLNCKSPNCLSNFKKVMNAIDDIEKSKFRVLCKYYKNGCKKITNLKNIFAHQQTCIHGYKGLNNLRMLKFFKKRNKIGFQVEIVIKQAIISRILSKYAFCCHKYLKRAIFYTLELRGFEPEHNVQMMIPFIDKIQIIRFASLDSKIKLQEEIFWGQLANVHTLYFNWCLDIKLYFWKELEKLSKLLKGLKNLILHQSTFEGIDFSNFLENIKDKEGNLKSISINGGSIKNHKETGYYDVWNCFNLTPSLEIIKYSFNNYRIESICSCFFTLPNLKQIEIINCNISESNSGISNIYQINSKSFESFRLCGYSFTHKSLVQTLISVLNTAPCLKVIELNNVGCSLLAFSDLLKPNNIIEEIYLQNHTWNDKEVEIFSQKLMVCQNLKILDLSIFAQDKKPYLLRYHNEFYVQQISNALIYINRIKKLIIENCLINNKTAEDIFSIILKCCNIESIKMSQYKEFPITYPNNFFDRLHEIIKGRKLDPTKFNFQDFNKLKTK